MKPDIVAGRLVRALARDSASTHQSAELSSLTFLRRVIVAVARRPVEITISSSDATSQLDSRGAANVGTRRTRGKSRQRSAWVAAVGATAAAAVAALFITGTLATPVRPPDGVGQSQHPSPTGTGQPPSPTPQGTATSGRLVGNDHAAGSGLGSLLLVIVGGLLVALGTGAVVILWMRRTEDGQEDNDS
jgi:hypothetical protein